jgi:hypothetical protein
MGASNLTFPTTVKPDAAAKVDRKTLSATLACGAWVRIDTNGKLAAAQGNSQAAAQAVGILMNGNGADQVGLIVTEGKITGCSGLVKGQWYCVSDDLAGAAMRPVDLGTGDWSTLLGYAISTTEFYVKIIRSELQV